MVLLLWKCKSMIFLNCLLVWIRGGTVFLEVKKEMAPIVCFKKKGDIKSNCNTTQKGKVSIYRMAGICSQLYFASTLDTRVRGFIRYAHTGSLDTSLQVC